MRGTSNKIRLARIYLINTNKLSNFSRKLQKTPANPLEAKLWWALTQRHIIEWQASSKGGSNKRTASIQKLSAVYGDCKLTPMTKALERTFQAYLVKQESTVEKGQD
jgi:hypothetical protein